MQVKEITAKDVIICPDCFRNYKPRNPDKLKECSYCHYKFEIKPDTRTISETIIKEKCQFCDHTFKPRSNRDKPVCPKCHKAL